jgi:DNA-binding MarR family transcriptional regulator
MTSYDFGTQLLTLYTIRNYVKLHGVPPTWTELAKLRNMHVTAIYKHLRQLEEGGYITRVKGWRNIRLTSRAA